MIRFEFWRTVSAERHDRYGKPYTWCSAEEVPVVVKAADLPKAIELCHKLFDLEVGDYTYTYKFKGAVQE